LDPISPGGRPLQTTLNEKKQAMVHERVMELLTIIQPKVFNSLNPGKIVNLFKLGEGKPPLMGKKTTEVVDGFYSFPGFTRLTSSEIIQKAIARGVREGVFGYYAGAPPTLGEDGKYQISESKVAYEKMVADDEIDLDMGFIMMPDAIPAARPIEESPGSGREPPGPQPPRPESPWPESPPPRPTEGQKRVSITFTANRDQLFGAWQAVANLADMAGKVFVTIDAESEEGFDKNKLRNAVIEPLQEADLIE